MSDARPAHLRRSTSHPASSNKRRRIGAAKDLVLSRAELIEDETTRSASLKRIPEHAATLDRAREWLD
jgi:hypothetical protein